MTGKPAMKLDAAAAWGAWMASGTPEAAAQFFDRVGPWMDGTAAQLTREAPRRPGARLTRAELADRLRAALGVLATGEPMTYLVALSRARQNVIDDLRSGPPA